MQGGLKVGFSFFKNTYNFTADWLLALHFQVPSRFDLSCDL